VGTTQNGDPYFVGFKDNEVFKFNGQNGHIYSLISSPEFQMNGLVDIGYAADHRHKLDSVLRSVAIMWDNQYSFVLSYSNRAELSANLTRLIDGRVVELDLTNSLKEDSVQLQLGSFQAEWIARSNSSKNYDGEKEHRIHQQMTLTHKDFVLELYTVELVVRQTQYYFLDMQVNLNPSAEAAHAAGRCWEGVWGRTTCVSSDSEFSAEEYDLEDLLLTDFPLHNYYAKSQLFV